MAVRKMKTEAEVHKEIMKEWNRSRCTPLRLER
jgi:hypothetical protein